MSAVQVGSTREIVDQIEIVIVRQLMMTDTHDSRNMEGRNTLQCVSKILRSAQN